MEGQSMFVRKTVVRKTSKVLVVFVLCGFALLAEETEDETPESTEETPATVEVEITVADVKEEVGTIYIGIFDNKEAWKKLEPTDEATTEAEVPESTTTVELEPGEYAVTAYHDVNEDGEFNRKGVFRLPAEPYALSNDARARLSAPGWNKVKFKVEGEKTKHTLTLKHP